MDGIEVLCAVTSNWSALQGQVSSAHLTTQQLITSIWLPTAIAASHIRRWLA
jgi:hypothetical protein